MAQKFLEEKNENVLYLDWSHLRYEQDEGTRDNQGNPQHSMPIQAFAQKQNPKEQGEDDAQFVQGSHPGKGPQL